MSAPINRIAVIGNIGSGLSTLANWLGDLLGLEVVNLGPICWRPGWEPVPVEESTEAIRQVVERERWVLDGVSRQATRRAEIVVYLDLPRRVVLWRTLRRNVPYLFRSRPEMPPRCPEIVKMPLVLKLLWRWQRDVHPDMLHHLDEARSRGAEVHHIHSQSELEAFKRTMRGRGKVTGGE